MDERSHLRDPFWDLWGLAACSVCCTSAACAIVCCMAKVSLGLRLDVELVKRVDEARGIVPRAAWIGRACERDLARLAVQVGPAVDLACVGGRLPGGRVG